MELQDLITLGLPKHSAASNRGSTGVSIGEICEGYCLTACKDPTDRFHIQLIQFPAGCPLDRVGIDVLGPFPCMERCNPMHTACQTRRQRP